MGNCLKRGDNQIQVIDNTPQRLIKPLEEKGLYVFYLIQ